nr:hypothetical protein [Tanacetum cinerariifolium]
MEIVMDQSGNTLRVSQSRFYNRKLVQTLFEGHCILSLHDSLLGDYDVEKNGKWSCIYVVGSQEYQMVCMRLDIASADIGTRNRVRIRAKDSSGYCYTCHIKGGPRIKADERFLVGYSMNSKSFRVFNSRKRIVEKNLYIRFSDSKPNVVGSRPNWLFDINALTRIMNYEPIALGTQSNGFIDPKSSHDDGFKPSSDAKKKEELLQFKLQEVWSLVDLPNGKKAIGTKWVFKNKKDERGIVIRNKARLVCQGQTQEEWIDYDEVSAPVARIEAIRLFLAYASFKDFIVYQIDVRSAFLYGKIKEEVHKGAIFLVPVYVDDIIFDSTRKELLKQKNDGMFISQDKYVGEMLKKFRFTEFKNERTPMETQKPLLKDEDGEEVDVHMYRSMISSLMYLTSSRPDIMFEVCACVRYQVNRKVSHLHVVKRIFSDYAGASLDRKSTTEGCQYLRSRLILWQCKKQIVVANSTTEDEYVAASSCSRQVLWIQNQLLDYGYNFIHTKIFIDNNSTICIIKNLVFI